MFARPLPHVDPHRYRGPVHRALVAFASSALVGRVSKTALWRMTTWKLERILQRASGGRLTTAIGLPTALLQTRGRRTGRTRRTGVIYFHDGEVVTIVASRAGYPGHPAWYYNARADPCVLLGIQPFIARVIDDESERARLWRLADLVFPGFAHYRAEAARHGRAIPILQLHPPGSY